MRTCMERGRADTSTPELDAMSYHAANRRALFYLEQEFEKCRDVDTPRVWAWLAFASWLWLYVLPLRIRSRWHC